MTPIAPTLVYRHIPKTGGITLSTFVVGHYGPGEAFHVRDPGQDGAPVLADRHGPVEALAALPERERAGIRCVVGHVREPLDDVLEAPLSQVTLIRDPVDRTLSQHRQYASMVEGGELRNAQSLEDFLDRSPAAVGDYQCRFLVGLRGVDDADAATVEAAYDVLRDYAVVGTVERFEDSVLVLCRRSGWPVTGFVRHNVRNRADDVDPAVRAAVAERCDPDARLHRQANELLDEALADYGPGLAADRETLRAACEREERRARSLVRRAVRKARATASRGVSGS